MNRCCSVIGISENTIRAWLKEGGMEDRRTTTDKKNPSNKLTSMERKSVREVLYSETLADKSPHKIVPALADRGIYLCSESTMYRILREDNATARRTQSRKDDVPRIKPNLIATAPGQVFNWDITYLPSTVRGLYYRALLILDMYSRRIMGHQVMYQDTLKKCSDYVGHLIEKENLSTLEALHGDNGKTLKGQTLASMLRSYGVIQSHSRPNVSNDNAYIESFFGTLKTDFRYPKKGFKNITEADRWMKQFVEWYNKEPHSSLNYVSPNQRHNNEEEAILTQRLEVFEKARQSNPERFPNGVRKIRIPKVVCLIPMEDEAIEEYLKEKEPGKYFAEELKVVKELVLKIAG